MTSIRIALVAPRFAMRRQNSLALKRSHSATSQPTQAARTTLVMAPAPW